MTLLIASLSEVDVLELERFLVQRRRLAFALVVPGGDVAEALVVALGFAVRVCGIHGDHGINSSVACHGRAVTRSLSCVLRGT